MPVSPPPPFDTQPWKGVTVPPEALSVQTMLSEEEGQMLYWLGLDYATGQGAACDLGCFAGGSSARLAAGLAAGGHGAVLHAYDHFLIQEEQKARYLYPAGIKPFEGTDMLPAVRQLLRPWAEQLVFHKGNLREIGWAGGPIELLFIDAAKTPQTTDFIAGVFMPSLIPGHSLVIHQDYQHWRQPWVPAQMELLSDCFELVAWTFKGTAVFRCCAPVTPDLAATRLTTPLPDGEMRRLLLNAIVRFPQRPQRRRLACAVLALEDNPGERLAYKFGSKGFGAERVNAVLREAFR
ncbi:MAG: hypothetical protein AAF409_06740 [Pseudomonadota bacterium]